MVGGVTRTGRGGVRWAGDLPQGCVGAPVFVSSRLSWDSFKLVCAGVVPPGDGQHPIAPFDRIRTRLRALAPDTESALETDGPNSRTPEPKRRW